MCQHTCFAAAASDSSSATLPAVLYLPVYLSIVCWPALLHDCGAVCLFAKKKPCCQQFQNHCLKACESRSSASPWDHVGVTVPVPQDSGNITGN